MSIIPGSIPVTGFIAPTDTSDDYAVTDAIYGIDGLRNVADYTERNNISIERRRAGMVVGTINDGKYWRLKNQAWTLGSSGDWELFLQVGPSGSLVSTGLKYVIEPSDDIEVPNYTQYWIYGDLTVYGQLTNYGEVVIADGGLVMSGGTFSNYGTLTFVTMTGTASGTASYVNSTTIDFTITGSTVSAQVITGSLTASHLNTGLNGGATAGHFLSVDVDGNFQWIPGSGVGTITGVNAGMGLTGGGVSGAVTLDVRVNNAISISNDDVVLGGTLSQNTIIDGDNTFGLSFSNIPLIHINQNLQIDGNLQSPDTNTYIYVSDNLVDITSSDVATGSSNVSVTNNDAKIETQDVVGKTVVRLSTYRQGQSVTDGSTNNTMIITDETSSKGVVYADDYTANFTTHSLITKGYADGLAFGGVVVSNGLTSTGGVILLGGTLSQTTTIDTNSNTFTIGNDTFDGFFRINPNISLEFKTVGGYFLLGTEGGNIGMTTNGGDVNLDVSGGGIYFNSTGGAINLVSDNLSTNSSKIGTTAYISQMHNYDIVNDRQNGFESTGSQAKMYVVDNILASASNIRLLVAGTNVVDGINGVDNAMIITDDLFTKGLVYNDDYSAKFTAESLVSKRYVDLLISTASIYTSGLTSTSGYIARLGGSLEQNTLVDGLYNLEFGSTSNQLNNFNIYVTASGAFYNYVSTVAAGTYSFIKNDFSSVSMTYQRGGAGGGNAVSVTPNETYMFSLSGGSQSLISTSIFGYPSNDGSTNNHMYVSDDIGNKGLVYLGDYSANFTPESIVSKRYVDSRISASSSKPTVNDKNLVAVDTTGDGIFSGATISGTPINNSYVSVFINGLEYLVGNGVTNSVDCYFSNDGGSNARGFSSAHPNGRVQANDRLYWNGNVTGVNLISGWRISLHYII